MLKTVVCAVVLFVDLLALLFIVLVEALGKMNGPGTITGWAIIGALALNMTAISLGLWLRSEPRPRRDDVLNTFG